MPTIKRKSDGKTIKIVRKDPVKVPKRTNPRKVA